ncbi:uncharacterized protein LY79DRAFT_562661 [Colletotrichum navitas]|uniref:Uncharacterized protein n=1 Tax=Colletotrichum navitas TaxID=681940 RepID=A0AAD8V2T9_9PEZI|nr:uncharacterized protein LY79DRAFT_562661 [Colletotrichum navitas]KAK1580043.1 hypothetical protein LY79DRAFT_562661 [Colletotrichum navitas]
MVCCGAGAVEPRRGDGGGVLFVRGTGACGDGGGGPDGDEVVEVACTFRVSEDRRRPVVRGLGQQRKRDARTRILFSDPFHPSFSLVYIVFVAANSYDLHPQAAGKLVYVGTKTPVIPPLVPFSDPRHFSSCDFISSRTLAIMRGDDSQLLAWLRCGIVQCWWGICCKTRGICCECPSRIEFWRCAPPPYMVIARV